MIDSNPVHLAGEPKDRLNLAFSMYDINGDGVLDKKEIGEFSSETRAGEELMFSSSSSDEVDLRGERQEECQTGDRT